MNFKAPMEQHTWKVIEWSTKEPNNWNVHQEMPKVLHFIGKIGENGLYHDVMVSLYKFEILNLHLSIASWYRRISYS